MPSIEQSVARTRREQNLDRALSLAVHGRVVPDDVVITARQFGLYLDREPGDNHVRLERDVRPDARNDWWFVRNLSDGTVQISKNTVEALHQDADLTQQAAVIVLTPEEWDQIVAAVGA